MDEFELIASYFKKDTSSVDTVVLGIGDDAAVVRPPPGSDLVLTMDTLVSGVHFVEDTDPLDLGHKSVAVNLSDLAAMSAVPAWAMLSLTVPHGDPKWLERFSQGLFGLLDRYEVPLVGGDTCRGPLSITVQAGGWIDARASVRRAGARPDDDLYVTGTLGDGAVGVLVESARYAPPDADRAWLLGRLHRPEPRVEVGRALAGIATAAIDISDGLVGDLSHVLESSNLPGAIVDLADLPLSEAARRYVDKAGSLDLIVAGGDDYELCFTAPADAAPRVRAVARDTGVSITRIGTIGGDSGIELRDPQGELRRVIRRGYSHF